MKEIIYSSAAKLALAIRDKKVSSEEVIEAHLRRIDEVNPKLNAIVHLRAEAALEDARKADKMLAKGESTGPLHGVPMTIKDSLDTAGEISTGGTAGRASFTPEEDATVVARLRSAGAILLGKTNLSELSLVGETDNALFGRTNNPYDLDRTPGGSSGGEGAIISAGGSPLGMGADSGGSIRKPACFCGITGLKPSMGRVPRTGHFPPMGGALDFRLQVGPMARFIEDLVLVMPILSGPDRVDPAMVAMPLGNPEDVRLGELRVAYYTDNGIVSPSPETVSTVQRVAEMLADSVLKIEEALPHVADKTHDIAGKLDQLEWAASDDWILEKAGTKDIHVFTQKLIEDRLPKETSASELLGLTLKWDAFKMDMLGFMERYDVIICPSNAFPAPHHGVTLEGGERADSSYTETYNLTGWPAVIVRAGTSSEGLPIGVQVVARHWRDDVALAVAQHIESVLGGWQTPPI